MHELTPRQTLVYEAIFWFMANEGIPPSVRELMELTKISSPNGVMCHLKALKRKGKINYRQRVARTIKLTNPDKCPYCYFNQAKKNKESTDLLYPWTPSDEPTLGSSRTDEPCQGSSRRLVSNWIVKKDS